LSKVGGSFQVVDLTKDNFQNLNGTYSNTSDTLVGAINSSNRASSEQQAVILGQLFQFYPETAWRDKNGNFINPKEKWIKIDFNSKKKASVSMYHNDKFVFSKNIRGKFKNGYFYIRPKIYVIPLFPVFFAYNFERARIGKTTNDDLIIDYTVNRLGFALVAGGSDNGATSSIYKKKKSQMHKNLLAMK
jgi:hypothetical protein